MACIKCEIRRAKLRAYALLAIGVSLDDIALQLSNVHGEAYFVNHEAGKGCTTVRIVRVNKLHPFTPHVIYERTIHHALI